MRRLLEIDRLEQAAEARAVRLAKRCDRMGRRYGLRVASSCALLVVTGAAFYSVSSGLETWDAQRKAQIRKDRAATEERLDHIRRAERDAVVAVDYARGREKRIASELYSRYGYVLAGLDLRLPAEAGKHTALKVEELCPPAPTAPTREAVGATGPASEQSSETEIARRVMLDCWRQLAEQARRGRPPADSAGTAA